MTQERQIDRPDDEGALNADGENQVKKLVLAAQACGGQAETPRTLDGHKIDDYLTPDGS